MRSHFAKAAGYTATVLSLLGLVAGLWLTQSLAGDVRATVLVSSSAIEVIGDTIEAVDDVAEDTSASMAAASASVDAASSTVDATVSTIEDVATFLEEDLTEDLETVREAMPAAVQTANAIDGTLRALSLLGVEYNPEEPFGESLAQIEVALTGLPAELRIQSESLRRLVPSAAGLAMDTSELSTSLDDLSEGLNGFTALTGDYAATIEEANTAISRTSDSVDTRLWLIRALIVITGSAGIAIGLALVAIGRSLEAIQGRMSARIEEPIPADP
jgi:ABC-type transporter Mla subunit MlaD